MEPNEPFDGYTVIKTDGLSQKEIAENILDVLSRIEWSEIKSEPETLSYTITQGPPGEPIALTWDLLFPKDGTTVFDSLRQKSNVVDFATAKRRLRPKFLTSL